MDTTLSPVSALRRGRRGLVHFMAVSFALLVLPAAGLAGEVQAWLLLLPNVASPASILTTDRRERDNLTQNGWKVSGTGLLQTEPGPGLGEVNRMVKTEGETVERAIEADPVIVGKRKAEGYVTEGVLGYAALRPAPGGIAITRYKKDSHALWLIGKADIDWAKNAQWKEDGVAFWLMPQ
jgi:hypothetical protein